MEQMLKQILTKLEVMDLKIDRIQQTLDAHHVENIEADNKLLEAIQTTNERLDFQRDKISKTEEEIYLLKQKH